MFKLSCQISVRVMSDKINFALLLRLCLFFIYVLPIHH